VGSLEPASARARGRLRIQSAGRCGAASDTAAVLSLRGGEPPVGIVSSWRPPAAGTSRPQAMRAAWFVAALYGAAAAQSVPTPRDIFSSKIKLDFEGFGIDACREIFPNADSFMSYAPPAGGVSSDVEFPAASLSVNKTACDAVEGFVFRVRDVGVDGQPLLNQYLPPENLLYMYATYSAEKLATPQCAPDAAGRLKDALVIRGFVLLEANKKFDAVLPAASLGKLPAQPGVKYFFFEFSTHSNTNTVFCLLSDGASLKSEATGGDGSGGSSKGKLAAPAASATSHVAAGAIAGIVIGVALLVACFAMILTWAHLRRRKQNSERSNSVLLDETAPP
jgi:hypothetical protein